VEDECEPFGRSERLENDVEGEADAVGDERLLFRSRRAVDRDDRLRHPGADEILATGPARSEHVETDATDDRRQPRAEVLDLRLVGAAQLDPHLLHCVVGLVDRAEHAVRDPAELRPLLLETRYQDVAISHLIWTTNERPET